MKQFLSDASFFLFITLIVFAFAALGVNQTLGIIEKSRAARLDSVYEQQSKQFDADTKIWHEDRAVEQKMARQVEEILSIAKSFVEGDK